MKSTLDFLKAKKCFIHQFSYLSPDLNPIGQLFSYVRQKDPQTATASEGGSNEKKWLDKTIKQKWCSSLIIEFETRRNFSFSKMWTETLNKLFWWQKQAPPVLCASLNILHSCCINILMPQNISSSKTDLLGRIYQASALQEPHIKEELTALKLL